MRLICPNCDAEYQVDDAAIPDGGRDVQCSNCGHAWFQLPADVETAREAEDELFGVDTAPGPAADNAAPGHAAPGDAVSVAAVQGDPLASEPASPDTAISDIAAQDAALTEALADAAFPAVDTAGVDDRADAPAPNAPTRQSLAESVLSVLREEAARETAVRRDEAPALSETSGAIETQTELGLDDPLNVASSSAAARHIARLKGADTEPPALGEAKASARRDLLPDIEEINSTLRANSDRAREADAEIDALPDLKRRGRGFRSGFVLMMIVAVALAMAYIMAPRIVAQMPGTAPTMRAYVAAVDKGRLWLDGVMQSASGSLRSLSGDAD